MPRRREAAPPPSTSTKPIDPAFLAQCVAVAEQAKRDEAAAAARKLAARTLTAPELAAFLTQGPTPPSALSDLEAKYYYAGRSPGTVLVARTGAALWAPPTAPGVAIAPKALRIVGVDAARPLREALGLALHSRSESGGAKGGLADVLDAHGVRWICIDFVRIAEEEEVDPPVVIWIGVSPGTLGRAEGYAAAMACKALVVERGIHDVEVEIRETVLWGSHAALQKS